MSKYFAVGLLALAPVASAQRFIGVSTGGSCADVSYCAIQTSHECGLAAASLSLSDTQPRNKNDATQIGGCSTNANGNLRFNSDMTVTEHNTGRGQRIFCQDCAQITTTTAAGPTCDDANMYCAVDGDCGENQCAITDAAMCGTAAAALGIEDTVAAEITATDKVSGCSFTNGGQLRFNSDDNSVVHNAANDQGVICSFCPPCLNGPCEQAGSCDGVYGCDPADITACDAAATALGIDTPAKAISRTNAPGGCHTTKTGLLRFNDMDTTVAHASGQGQVVVCVSCEP